MKKILLLLTVAVFFVSCTDEDTILLNDEVQQENTPGATAQNMESIFRDESSFVRIYDQEKISVFTAINVDSNQDYSALTGFGICYGTLPNVTLQTGTVIQNTYVNYNTPNYEIDIQDAIPGTTYYIRPFAMNGDIPVYGSEKTVTTLQPLTMIKGKNFSIGGMTIDATLNTNLQGALLRIGNENIFANVSDDLYTADIQFSGLTFIGSIVTRYQNIFYYTTVPAFEHNVGQTGEGGGEIFFDKGEYSDGWRYMERSYQRYWDLGFGCNGTSVVTQQEVQSGYANTIAIVNSCTENSAAKFCYNLVLNGKDDWYMPSSGEVKLFTVSLIGESTLLSGEIATSSQASATTYYMAKFNHHYDTVIIETNKNEFGIVIPVRRY